MTTTTTRSPLAQAAASTRADIRILAKKGLLPPHPEGITFRVRSERGSLMSSLDIEILGVPREWEYTGGRGAISRPSPALMTLKEALRRIAARHWDADGEITFIEVQVDPQTAIAEPVAVEDVIAAWPALPEHAGADGARCTFSGVASESGQCPDRCASLAGDEDEDECGYQPYDWDDDGWDRSGVSDGRGHVYSDADPGL